MKEETQHLFEKALRTIHAAEVLLNNDECEVAAGRAYYAMFHIAKALLCEKGLRRFTKHRAVHAAFGENFSKTEVLPPKFHRWMLEAFDARIKGDYEIVPVVSSQDVMTMLKQAREFLEAAREYLSQAGSS